ncbi:hypothetical protein [Actinosynnema sp. NPDC023587]
MRTRATCRERGHTAIEPAAAGEVPIDVTVDQRCGSPDGPALRARVHLRG